MAVGAQHDLGGGPVGADRPKQAAQQGADLLAGRPFSGTKHGGDEAALAVEHDDRLKAVFVVMGIEQPQLLAAVHRIERVVDVEDDALGHLREGLAVQIHHGATHAQQGAGIGQVLQARDRRLRTQLAIGRRQVHGHLEHRVVAKRRGIVAVFITCRDHQHPKSKDVGETMRDLLGRARVFDTGGQTIGDAEALLDLAQDQNAAIGRQQTAVAQPSCRRRVTGRAAAA